MSALRKLASQTAVYGLSSIIGRVVVWGLTPVYTASMPQAEYGIFSDLYAFVTYFLVILTFGMETSFFRFSMEKEMGNKPYDQAFLFISVLATSFLIIFGLSHSVFADVLGYEQRPELVLMIIIIIFLDVMIALPMARLRHEERPVLFAGVTLFTILLNLGLNVVFYVVLGKTTADYVFISNIIASATRFMILLLLSSPLASHIPRIGKKGLHLAPGNFRPDRKLILEMSGYGLFIMLAGLSGMINQNSDVNFIKRVWGDSPQLFGGLMRTGEELAGIYSANKKLAVMVLLVTQAFRYAAEPFFFRHASEKGSKKDFARVFHYFMLAALAVFLFVGSFAKEFVSIRIFGFQIIDEKYHSGLEVVPLLLLAFVLWGAYTNISIWYKITRQVRFGLLFTAAGTFIVVLLNLILIPFYGYFGAAIAMIACYGGMVLLCYSFGQKYYPIPYQVNRIILYTILTAAIVYWNSGPESELFSSVFWWKLMRASVLCALVFAIEKWIPPFRFMQKNPQGKIINPDADNRIKDIPEKSAESNSGDVQNPEDSDPN